MTIDFGKIVLGNLTSLDMTLAVEEQKKGNKRARLEPQILSDTSDLYEQVSLLLADQDDSFGCVNSRLPALITPEMTAEIMSKNSIVLEPLGSIATPPNPAHLVRQKQHPTIIPFKPQTARHIDQTFPAQVDTRKATAVPSSIQYDEEGYLKPQSSNSKRPPLSYATLIVLALCSSETGKLPLHEIYSWIVTTFPYYETCDKNWKVSATYSLSNS
jgi:hypothetical protein